MGQFALGIRSLLFKLAIFVVMASLLAWALGGTLFPRPETARLREVAFAGRQWFFRLSVGGKVKGNVRWDLMYQDADDRAQRFGEASWADVAGPVIVKDTMYFGGVVSRETGQPWMIERVAADLKVTSTAVPDRLAVEQQLARLAAGLELQDTPTILRQRAGVLDPQHDLADEPAQAHEAGR